METPLQDFRNLNKNSRYLLCRVKKMCHVINASTVKSIILLFEELILETDFLYYIS